MREFSVTVTVDDGEDFREFNYLMNGSSLDEALDELLWKLDSHRKYVCDG